MSLFHAAQGDGEFVYSSPSALRVAGSISGLPRCFTKEKPTLPLWTQAAQAKLCASASRRDVRRFLRSERATYPSMPHDYFDEGTAWQLTAFRRRALADRHEAVMEAFPGCSEATLQARWHPAAARLMANWLGQLTVPKVPQHKRAIFTDTDRAAVTTSARDSAVPLSPRDL